MTFSQHSTEAEGLAGMGNVSINLTRCKLTKHIQIFELQFHFQKKLASTSEIYEYGFLQLNSK